MKKYIAETFICACFILAFGGCTSRYGTVDFIGKTSAEIIREYGSFDCTFIPAGEDGLYRNCRCGYTTRAPKTGFLGRSEEMLVYILFDENGIAVGCEEGCRPGGQIIFSS